MQHTSRRGVVLQSSSAELSVAQIMAWCPSPLRQPYHSPRMHVETRRAFASRSLLARSPAALLHPLPTRVWTDCRASPDFPLFFRHCFARQAPDRSRPPSFPSFSHSRVNTTAAKGVLQSPPHNRNGPAPHTWDHSMGVDGEGP
ncbi:hypothetical protein MAPG_05851 [Magnaporthiopsis poae ATCC 64411]|uniref:Uncharacterized protein n=1 Tax=Magnaporthiopsis poae (strain ATCC 64411 / 73-15) TaxID=644358 RepID=A0A0C4E0H8_MAGP6|nr:hypothetical protein MAPG_05851 [Magnaporthiopsis poae ATCC 64411]